MTYPAARRLLPPGVRRLGRNFGAVATALGLVFLISSAANAAYYNTYSDVGPTPNVSQCNSDGGGSCSGAQGFAAGSVYMYVVKTRTSQDNDRSAIYRVNKDTGSYQVMTNGSNSTLYNTWLGHANDMTLATINGVNHLYVVTMNATGAQLVDLTYSGNTYNRAGSFTLRDRLPDGTAGAIRPATGISKVAVSGTAITFFFKSGSHLYTGSLSLSATSGTVYLTPALDLDRSNATLNGVPMPDLADPSLYADQGFFYDAGQDTVYYPLTGRSKADPDNVNTSVVLVYRNVTPATTGTVPSDPDLSFRVTSSKYSSFEIESVALNGGELYFNTNRVLADPPAGGATTADGVQVFNGYNANG